MTGTITLQTSAPPLTWKLAATRKDADWGAPLRDDGEVFHAGTAMVVRYQAENLPLALICYAYAAYPDGVPESWTVHATLERIAGGNSADPVGTETWSDWVTVEVPNDCLVRDEADAVAAYVAYLLAAGDWPVLAAVAPELLAALQAWDGRPYDRKPAVSPA